MAFQAKELVHDINGRYGTEERRHLLHLIAFESCFAAVGIDRQRLGNEFEHHVTRPRHRLALLRRGDAVFADHQGHSCNQGGLGDDQIGYQELAFGLGPVESRCGPSEATDPRPDNHRQSQSCAVTFSDEGRHQWHEAAEDGPLMVAERSCGRPNLGRETLVQVGHHLPMYPAASAHSLSDETQHDP